MALERPKQDADVIWQECEEQEKVWTDPDFPTVKKSLCPPNEWNTKTWECEIEWIRASKIPSLTDEEGDNHVFTMIQDENGQKGYDIQPGDVMRGLIKDSYFLSVVSCLAERPRKIQQLFTIDEVNEWGFYAIDLTKNGIPTTVVIDDYIPCDEDEGEPIFANSRNGDLWVLLLEKAWAKLHGSYMRIENGDSTTVFRDLTGAPTYFMEFYRGEDDYGEEEKEEEPFDDDIQVALTNEMNPIVYLCSRNEKDVGPEVVETYKKLGIMPDSAFAILKILDINDKKILQIRNPQATDECKWTGKWSEDSAEWTDKIKEDHLKDGDFDKGKFFMEWKDVFANYSGYGICGCEVGYLQSAKKTGPIAIFKATIQDEEGQEQSWFSLSQKGERMFPRNAGYKYSFARMHIFKLKGKGLKDGMEFIEASSGQTRDMHCSTWQGTKYKKGEYYVVAEVDWIEATQDKSFNVTAYGYSTVTFEDITDSIDKAQIMKKYAESLYQEYDNDVKQGNEDDSLIYFYRQPYDFEFPGSNDESWDKRACALEFYSDGLYTIRVIDNKTDKVWVETSNFPEPGMQVIYPSNGKEYEVRVQPNSVEYVLIRQSHNSDGDQDLKYYPEPVEAGSQMEGSQMDEEEME